MTYLHLDHLTYIRKASHRREVHAALRRLLNENPGPLSEMDVVHEADNSCCRLEPWATTRARLAAAVSADGERLVAVPL